MPLLFERSFSKSWLRHDLTYLKARIVIPGAGDRLHGLPARGYFIIPRGRRPAAFRLSACGCSAMNRMSAPKIHKGLSGFHTGRLERTVVAYLSDLRLGRGAMTLEAQ